MKPATLTCVVVLLTLFALTGLAAAELEGVTLPDTVKVGETELVLNGLGLREATFLKVDVYVSGLYLPAKTSDAKAIIALDEPKQIQMKFVHSAPKKKLIAAWNEGFEENSSKEAFAAAAEGLKTLNGYMVDIKDGDTMTFTYLPGSGVECRIKGKVLGTIPGKPFAQALFAVWFGPEPPNEDLKAGMLGKH